MNHYDSNSFELAVYTFERNVPTVPEPSSAAMLGVGLAGLALLRRKRQA